MNKVTALALFAAFTLGTSYAHATSSVPATPPGPPPAMAEQPPGPPPGDHGPGDHGPGGPGGPERFEAADTNHDGFLTKEEMLNMQKERLDKMFAEADSNHDGKLSKEELETSFQSMREKMRARFEQSRQGMPPQQ